MKNINLNTISNGTLLHKLLTCVVSFFILINSIGIYKSNIGIVETVKVSANTIVVHFFYVYMLPMNAVSKMFVNTEKNTLSDTTKQGSKNEKSKQENSSKASVGYSIVAETINCQFGKVKSSKYFAFSDKIKDVKNIVWFESYRFVSIENVYKFGFIIMLLLAILLTRRNIGNDNIRIIKNNKSAQLA